ncbi:hypothetical protein E2C01_040572 [Portunus trituberculatus]|uniref:Uncharacterized protein n=1 Tax=Portunus trituberculatus TaxID=210409 RepID=A0A5B7FK53_PORTR|nr:hypothetical protein [Portunus trituberculatus]
MYLASTQRAAGQAGRHAGSGETWLGLAGAGGGPSSDLSPQLFIIPSSARRPGVTESHPHITTARNRREEAIISDNKR